MEEQNNNKSKWQTFKEIWKNKKYNALIKLGLYFLFFTFIILYIKLNETGKIDSKVETKKDALSSYSEMKNYDYVLKYSDDSLNKEITGTFYDKMNYFELNNLEYHYKDEILTQNEQVVDNKIITDFIPINILKFSNYNISSLIEKATSNKSVKYSDGTSKLEYIISYANFIQWYNNQVLTDDGQTVKITVYKLNDVINEIEFSGTLNKPFKLNITYLHINEIEDIETGV